MTLSLPPCPLPGAALLRDLCQLAEPQHPHCSQTRLCPPAQPVACQVEASNIPTCSPSGSAPAVWLLLQLVTCAQTAPGCPYRLTSLDTSSTESWGGGRR